MKKRVKKTMNIPNWELDYLNHIDYLTFTGISVDSTIDYLTTATHIDYLTTATTATHIDYHTTTGGDIDYHTFTATHIDYHTNYLTATHIDYLTTTGGDIIDTSIGNAIVKLKCLLKDSIQILLEAIQTTKHYKSHPINSIVDIPKESLEWLVVGIILQSPIQSLSNYVFPSIVNTITESFNSTDEEYLKMIYFLEKTIGREIELVIVDALTDTLLKVLEIDINNLSEFVVFVDQLKGKLKELYFLKSIFGVEFYYSNPTLLDYNIHYPFLELMVPYGSDFGSFMVPYGSSIGVPYGSSVGVPYGGSVGVPYGGSVESDFGSFMEHGVGGGCGGYVVESVLPGIRIGDCVLLKEDVVWININL